MNPSSGGLSELSVIILTVVKTKTLLILCSGVLSSVLNTYFFLFHYMGCAA